MVVGVARLQLHIPAARSLKDRRMVVRKATDRVRARYNASIADVGDTERWQVVTLGVAVVSNDPSHAREVLDKVIATVESSIAGEAMVTWRETDVQTHASDDPVGRPGPRGLAALDEEDSDDEPT
jgi:uncharacterized protein YlxP (DUF503 family)